MIVLFLELFFILVFEDKDTRFWIDESKMRLVILENDKMR